MPESQPVQNNLITTLPLVSTHATFHTFEHSYTKGILYLKKTMQGFQEWQVFEQFDEYSLRSECPHIQALDDTSSRQVSWWKTTILNKPQMWGDLKKQSQPHKARSPQFHDKRLFWLNQAGHKMSFPIKPEAVSTGHFYGSLAVLYEFFERPNSQCFCDTTITASVSGHETAFSPHFLFKNRIPAILTRSALQRLAWFFWVGQCWKASIAGKPFLQRNQQENAASRRMRYHWPRERGLKQQWVHVAIVNRPKMAIVGSRMCTHST